MRRLPLLIVPLLSLLIAPAADARDRRAEAAAALRPIAGAEAKSCIPLRSIRETRVRDDSTIDFYMTGKTIYRNTLPHSCPQLGFEQSFTYATSLTQLCSTDIITVLYRGGGLSRGASCGLGRFQPVAPTETGASQKQEGPPPR